MTEKETKDSVQQIKRSGTILTVLVIGIVILFLVLVYLSSSPSEQEVPLTLNERLDRAVFGESGDNYFNYNGFGVAEDQGLWYIRVGRAASNGQEYTEFNIPFYHNPTEVEDVSYEQGAREALLGKEKIFLVQDPNSSAELSVASIEVGRIVGDRYGLLGVPTEATLTSDSPEGKPDITCEDVTRFRGVVYFTLGDETRVYEEGGCLIVQGTTPREVIRAADRLAFAMLNIISDDLAQPKPQSEVLSEAIIDDKTAIRIHRVIHSDSLEFSRNDAFIIQDVAEGVFHSILVEVVNSGQEELVFTPGVFEISWNETTYPFEFQTQRFLPGKLDLSNTVAPLSSEVYQMVFDLPVIALEFDVVVDFVGKEEVRVPVALDLE